MRSNFKIKVLTLMIASTASHSMAGTLRVITKVNSPEGEIRAALLTSQEEFESDGMFMGTFAPVSMNSATLEFDDVPAGIYGVALYQDLNGNQELDRNALGIPTEPFGFSNNPTIRFSAPTFDDFKFEFSGRDQEIEVNLNDGF